MSEYSLVVYIILKILMLDYHFRDWINLCNMYAYILF